MFSLSSRLLVCCLACSLAWVSSARAEPTAAARAASARSLFEEGLSKADAAQWSEAADLFERALALRDSPVIRYNLSSALLELGRLVEASAQLQTLANDERATEELRVGARERRASLLPRLAELTVRVDGHDPSMLVLLDDRKLLPEQLGIALAVDPRAHHVVLRSGERLLDDEHLSLAEGQSAEVRLVGSVPTPVVATSAPLIVGRLQRSSPRADFGEPADDSRDRRKKRLYWGLGAGAVAVAAGVVTAVLLVGRKSDGGHADAFSPGSVGVRVPQ